MSRRVSVSIGNSNRQVWAELQAVNTPKRAKNAIFGVLMEYSVADRGRMDPGVL